MAYGDGTTLKTLGPNGEVPETRMRDAEACQNWVRRLIQNDTQRSLKRSRVNGLVDGNPPYKQSKLAAAGRSDAANFNSGNARSYMEAGTGSFYDLYSEAPSAITFRTGHGTPEEKEVWSDQASGLADMVFKADRVWDYQMQISQWDMVLHGCGPYFFEDGMQVFPRAVLCEDLKVPERTKSDTEYWDGGFIQCEYYPPQLYKFIDNESAATSVGWNVAYVKKVIENAVDVQQQPGVIYDWTWYQQQMKNNSLTYYDSTLVCRLAHVFWQEFDGKITHAIVERDTTDGIQTEYLYLRVGRYENWREAIHPMYFDHGNGGYHHSVTGMGVKMYSIMEYENRLINNMADKAFAPKILFNPTTTEAGQKFSLARMGDYAVMPKGFQVAQAGVAGLMNDTLEMRAELTGIINNVLSNYRQGVTTQKSGNPVTKFEKQMEAAMQSALSMPQYNRYYKQLDMLYEEIWRRLTNPNSTDERAKKFQKDCKELGIPKEALSNVEYIGATRVVGQGSAFMRKQAVDSLLPLAGSLTEKGRNNLINDKIAAEAGQVAVSRYNPDDLKSQLPSDQQADAALWVAAIKTGAQFVPTSSQNPVIYASTFLSSAVQAFNSIQQGADPHEVLQFLNNIGPAIGVCLHRFGQDQTRQGVHQKLMEQFKQLIQMTDKLTEQLKASAQQQQQQKQKTQDVMTDQQIKQQKAQTDIQIKVAKTKAQLQQAAQKHQLANAQKIQDIKLNDAKAASEIHLNRLKAFSKPKTNGE